MANSILLVDDNKSFADTFAEQLSFQGFSVDISYSYEDAISLLNRNYYDVCIFDVLLDDGSGIALSRYVIDNNLKSQIILITAYGVSLNDIDNTVKDYVFDFLQKPFELRYALKRVRNAIERAYFLADREYEADKLTKTYKLIGKSRAIKVVRELIGKFSNVSSPVLITGETGTGKELVARQIHLSGNRRNKPFIPINCSAIPGELFESEFFGYEKGAFTGADKTKKGFFELAGDGTLFLDEIGDMDFNFQAKLLRVLETGEFMRVGGNRVLKSTARIIAATNRELKQDVINKNFREDLFYRISVLHIKIPPLRERREDIPLIARYLWENLSKQLKINRPLPDDEWFLALSKRDWNGNVRELSNYIERILIIGDNELKSEESNLREIILPHNEKEILPLDKVVKKYILKSYELCGYNKKQTAEKLGISLSTLKRRLKEYKID